MLIKYSWREKKNPRIFLKMVVCSYLQFASLQDLLLAGVRASQESPTSWRESPGSSFLTPESPGLLNQTPRAGQQVWGETPSLCARRPVDVLEAPPLMEARPHYMTNSRRSSRPRWRKITTEEEFSLFPSDCPVGIKIPPPGYRMQTFKMHKDRWDLPLSPWPPAPQTLMIW